MNKARSKRPAVFLLSSLLVSFVLPLAVLAMGSDPDDGETRREPIERTQSPDAYGQQRDSGNLFDAYGAWKERRKELDKEKDEGRFLPTEDSMAS